MASSMARSGSSSRSMREACSFGGGGAVGAGVDSEGVGGTEAMVLARRSGWAARRDAAILELGCGACWTCAS